MFPEGSVDLTLKKYCTEGVRPTKVTVWEVTIKLFPWERLYEPGFPPFEAGLYSTKEFATSFVVHVMTMEVEVAVPRVTAEIVGAVASPGDAAVVKV